MNTTYSYKEAAQMLGLTVRKLSQMLPEYEQSSIPASIVDEIAKEQQQYISLPEVCSELSTAAFDGTRAYNRKRLINELEINNYFGIRTVDPSDLVSGSEKDYVYFYRNDFTALKLFLSPFLSNFSATSEERIEAALRTDKTHRVTVACLRDYLSEVFVESAPTPMTVDFVRAMLNLPDLPYITDGDIQAALSDSLPVGARDHIINFCNHARKKNRVQYSLLSRVKPEGKPTPAYKDETYIALARYIFSAEYIDSHKMIEKSLENHIFIEMWLYLALYFTCGWRAEDICRNWKYLHLRDKAPEGIKIQVETLYEDLLYDRIPDEIYEKVCQYAVGSIGLSGVAPSKTANRGANPLVIAIAPEQSTFFGLLTLISESVMLRTGDGYMKPERASLYQSKANYRSFFGEEMYETLRGTNIQSRRLNKDYLQGIEETAQKTGCGSLMSSALASYARGHNNLDTISHYLKDHALSGENAEMVLYFMMDRGVFGFEAYQTLLTAYPDVMRKLPMKQQNEIISVFTTSPYQIELEHSGTVAKMHIKEQFVAGNKKETLLILKNMYEISQGRGKGKDSGIHCILRVRDEVCCHPEYESCLANACPYLVFTRYGYAALIEVLKQFRDAALSGDKKAEAALKKVILPMYRDILNAFMNEMGISKEERLGMKRLMEENL